MDNALLPLLVAVGRRAYAWTLHRRAFFGTCFRAGVPVTLVTPGIGVWRPARQS